MRRPVIVDGCRTPFGRFKGALKSVRPDDLASLVIQTLAERHDLKNHPVDDVILGCVNQAGEDNRNVARMSLLLAGLADVTPGVTVNRLCGSGLEAVNQAAMQIQVGRAKVVIAGGVESMTRSPYVMLKPEIGFSRGNQSLVDTTIGWRFINPHLNQLYPIVSLGESAEIMAEKFHISRLEQDTFAFESHHKAAKAEEAGLFAKEIIPVYEPHSEEVLLQKDEHVRGQTSVDALSALPPAFKKNGTVTAGNSSGINDGACVLLLMEYDYAIQNGYTPLAEILSSAVAGVHPSLLGMGPIPASQKALLHAGLQIEDIDLFEISEAFAAMTLTSIKEMHLHPEKVNVNGGGIALGHPLGASGARMVLTLIQELQRRKKTYGLVTMCIGVGQGIATIVRAL
ncbi:thiolase family protein [Leptospira ognonensis]|uniref:acetyl-CoA C-acyltransferase n=1 Tax=Leptospira ognonensis TaxID=2484945 RepID=A0A4V3JR84_9LEPT|nr:thiolase family protein [Leptospira ognonensis]TGL59075.1 thiolase family protein [Leptospira ognonensis]